MVKENQKNEKKVFVLDTNVLLHDPECCKNFQEHDIVIPIYVLEEIDRFKKGTDIINMNARHFSQFVDKIMEDKIFNGGIPLGKKLGKIRVALGVKYPKDFVGSFMEDTIDHRILCIAFDLKTKKRENIVLVSKDINFRLKAKALGIPAEDYRKDTIKNVGILENIITETSKDQIEMLKKLKENQFFRCPEGLFRWNK
ncbi:MAG: hypothetical protein LBI53_04060 [Candidatus Peribacteria bacterium]|jgi:PhoH-like ATPase|nr:hypothetical protein [Candidatus Peribacteria bacterium]